MGEFSLDRPVTEFLSNAAFLLREGWTVDGALAELRSGRCHSTETGTVRNGSRHVSGIGQGGEGAVHHHRVEGREHQSEVVYFYVTNDAGQLVGVLPSRALVLSAGSAKIGEVMTREIITMSAKETLFDAMELFALHRLLAIPVVDGERRMLGVVELALYADEVFDLAKRWELNEVFQLIGLRVEEKKQGSAWRGFRMRMPWLLSNIAGGLACAGLGELFRSTVERVVLIALFIPLVLTLAESIAVQTMTLAIERAARGGKGGSPWGQEIATALMLGACSGGIVAAVSMFWPGPRGSSLVIGGAVTLVMLAAAMLGRLVPRGIHALKLNPRVASGPITLAVVDIVAITTYLSLASAAL